MFYQLQNPARISACKLYRSSEQWEESHLTHLEVHNIGFAVESTSTELTSSCNLLDDNPIPLPVHHPIHDIL